MRRWNRANTTTYYYATDFPGSVTGLIRSDGTLVSQYFYTPFGVLLSSDNYGPVGGPMTTVDTVTNPLRFAAREYDAETGLYFMRARYYDPALGRFISEDPIGLGGGINPYTYAADDPVNNTDPLGLGPCYIILDINYYVDTGEVASVMAVGFYGDCNKGSGGGAGPKSRPTQQPQRQSQAPPNCPDWLRNPQLLAIASQLMGDSRLANGLWIMEQGGWLVSDQHGGITIDRVGHGARAGMDPGPIPPGNPPFIHSHPNGPPWLPGFSAADRGWSNRNNTAILAVSFDSIHAHLPFQPDMACPRR